MAVVIFVRFPGARHIDTIRRLACSFCRHAQLNVRHLGDDDDDGDELDVVDVGDDDDGP